MCVVWVCVVWVCVGVRVCRCVGVKRCWSWKCRDVLDCFVAAYISCSCIRCVTLAGPFYLIYWQGQHFCNMPFFSPPPPQDIHFELLNFETSRKTLTISFPVSILLMLQFSCRASQVNISFFVVNISCLKLPETVLIWLVDIAESIEYSEKFDKYFLHGN